MFSTLLPTTQHLTLTVREQKRMVYQGPARAVTSVNVKGRFDILPEHANFISVIKDYLIIHNADGSERKISLTRGVLKAEHNVITIYLGIASAEKSKNPSLSAK